MYVHKIYEPCAQPISLDTTVMSSITKICTLTWIGSYGSLWKIQRGRSIAICMKRMFTISEMIFRNLSIWESLSAVNTCAIYMKFPICYLFVSGITSGTMKTPGIPGIRPTRKRLLARPIRKAYPKKCEKIDERDIDFCSIPLEDWINFLGKLEANDTRRRAACEA